VVLLAAGPGYGKTTALQAMVAERPALATVWLTLDAFDAEPVAFFTALLRQMRRHIPAFGVEMEPLLLSGTPAPRLLVRRFLEAVEDYNTPGLHLVLDNFQHLTESAPDLDAAWFGGVERLPAGVRVLIASRRRPHAPLTRLRASGLLTVLGADDLRLAPAESEALVRGRLGLREAHIPEVWRQVIERLEGWPLGLTLLASVATPSLHGGPADDTLEALAAYVTEECWLALQPERQRWLCRAATLDALTPDALTVVLEEPAPHATLAELEAECLVSRAGEAWHIPAHLRAFLQRRAVEVLAPDERIGLARRAASWHADREDVERALQQLTAIAAWAEAVDVCRQAFPALMAYGRAASVARCLEAFPAAVVEVQPWLLLWRGNVALRRGDHGAARDLYERARWLFEESGEEAGAFKAKVHLGMVSLFSGDLAQFERLVATMPAPAAAAQAEDLADMALVKGLAAEHRGDHQDMRRCNEAVLAIPIENNVEVAACHATALINLHSLAFYHGDLDGARGRAEAAVVLAEAWRFLAYRTFVTFLLAHVQIVEGKPSQAEALLRPLPETWEDGLDFHERAIAHLVLGRLRAAQGDWRQAEAEMGRSQTLFADHAVGRKLVLEHRMWAHMAHGQVEWVASALEQAKVQPSQGLHDAALLLPHARALHLLGRPSEALAALDAALPELERQEARLHLARGRRIEAAAAARAGQPQRATAAWRAAAALVETWHYGFLAGEDPTLEAELGSLVAPARRAATANEAAPRLTISCLGGFEVHRDGVPLAARLRRKAKLVLAALALHPRGMRPADIAEALGRETFTAANLNTLQADIAELRRALEPGLGRGQASRFVLSRDGRYVLAWDAIEPTDVATLERALTEAERLAAVADARAEEAFLAAVELHTGTLLPDGFFLDHFQAEREGLAARVTRAFSWLAAHHRGRGAWDQAEAMLNRAIALSPCDEALYVERMALAVVLGRPERVRQIYWDCRKALKAHLGVAPSEAFEAAHGQVAERLVRRYT
jgi:LuxR family maltose regulon positive regulatory protein